MKEAWIHKGNRISSLFTCESSMFYFKQRNDKVICNRKEGLSDIDTTSLSPIFWRVNQPWSNPDSQIVAAMGKRMVCKAFSGTLEQVAHICRSANRYGRFDYRLSQEENDARYLAEEKIIAERINKTITDGGKLYSISFGREIGIVTEKNGHIDHLYIEGQYQRMGFGTRLLEYVLSMAEKEAYIDVPPSNKALLCICNKLGLIKTKEMEYAVRMTKP